MFSPLKLARGRFPRWAVCGLLVLLTPKLFASASPRSAVDSFQEGNARYEQGQYAEAAGAYENALRQGKQSANLFYNLANAYHRLGERGRAIVNYRRALALQPEHAEAAANLAFVRRALGVPGTEPSAGAILPLSARWESAATAAAAVGGWLLLGGGIVALWRGLGEAVRRRAALVAGVVGLPLLLAGTGAAWAAGRAPRRAARTAVVITKRAEARYAPADNAKVAASLTEGNEVRLLVSRGPWAYVELADGRRAFAPADRLEALVPAAGW